jgi:hypothetical protein
MPIPMIKMDPPQTKSCESDCWLRVNDVLSCRPKSECDLVEKKLAEIRFPVTPTGLMVGP